MYRTRLPRRKGQSYGKPSKLYQVWINLKGRTNGTSTRTPDLYRGLELGFSSFEEFRKFALANGFSKETPSPDRKDSTKGYIPGNIQFITKQENFLKSLRYGNAGAQPDGPEPPPYFPEEEEVPF